MVKDVFVKNATLINLTELIIAEFVKSMYQKDQEGNFFKNFF
jgi:hypothetical protein